MIKALSGSMAYFGRCRARAWLEMNMKISIKVYTFIVLFVQPRPQHFKASHWLRVRGKVLQWLFPRTTVQFYLFHVAAKTTAKLEFKCNFSSLPQIEVCRNRVALRDHTSWHVNPPFFSPSWTNSEMKIYLNDRQWAGESPFIMQRY